MITVETETGSTYLIDSASKKIKRSNDNKTDYSKMRRDNDWLSYSNDPQINVGETMIFVLEPLGEGDATIRETSYVTNITES